MFVFLTPKIFLSFYYLTSHLLSFELHIMEVKMNGAPLLLTQTLNKYNKYSNSHRPHNRWYLESSG